MQLLKDVNVDWIGRKRLWLSLSLLLIAASLITLYVKGGPRYGIDFRGGTLVYVKFKDSPDLGRIRSALSEQGLSGSTIQRYDVPERNEVIIGLGQREGEVGTDTDAGRVLILEGLQSTFGSSPGQEGKIDLNNAAPDELEGRLSGVAGLASLLESDDSPAFKTPGELARAVTDYRDRNGGIIGAFQDLESVEGMSPPVLAAVREQAYLGDFAVFQTEFVGPKVGRRLQRQAINATLYALLGMLVYIAFRFKGTVYGAAAVVAVFHDVVITLGFFSAADRELSIPVVAALLTLVGYSMNDTIVVFDRIRENLRLRRRESISSIVNRSINQTLSRTLLTSGSTFLTVLSLYYFGGQVINGFAFCLVVGVAVGTYSSIGVASQLLVIWYDFQARRKAVARPARA